MLNANRFRNNKNPLDAVVGFGAATNNKLGVDNNVEHESTVSFNTPRFWNLNDEYSFPSPIDNIYCFFDITLLVARDGTLYSRGIVSNLISEVDIQNDIRNELVGCVVEDVSISGNSLLLLYSNQRPYVLSRSERNLVRAPYCMSRGPVKKVCMGYSASFYINDKNEVYGFGDERAVGCKSDTNQIDYQSLLAPDDYIVSISSGYQQCAAVSKNGVAFFHGYNGHNEGLVQVTSSKPNVVTWFSDRNIKIKSVSCGIFHTMWLSDDNTLYTSGRNNEGELGSEDPDPQLPVVTRLDNGYIEEIQAGGSSSAFLTSDNKLYFCGSFNYLTHNRNESTGQSKFRDLDELLTLNKDVINPAALSVFHSYYNNPIYEKAFVLGSDHHFVLFKKRWIRTHDRLYGILSAELLCDIAILTLQSEQ